MHIAEKANIREPIELVPETLIKSLDHLHKLRSILPGEIVDYWEKQAKDWKERGQQLPYLEFSKRFGHVPRSAEPRQIPAQKNEKGKDLTAAELQNAQNKAEKEAAAKYVSRLEQWMFGANPDLAGNQLIFHLTTYLLKRPQLSTVEQESCLSTIVGAQARLNYEKTIARLTKKLEKQNLVMEDREKITQNLDYLKSDIGKERFHVKSSNWQDSHLRNLKKNDPGKYKEKLEKLNNQAFNEFHRAASRPSHLIGRPDGKFFAMGIWDFSYLQGYLQEEPGSNPTDFKGITLLVSRQNPGTQQLENLVCYTKRDAFAPTHHLSATLQTSLSNPDLKPIFDDIIKALNEEGEVIIDHQSGGIVAGLVKNIPLACLPAAGHDNNDNRFRLSPTGHIALNYEALTSSQKETLNIAIEKSKQKVAWLTEAQINALGSFGLVDANGKKAPALNPFLQATRNYSRNLFEEILLQPIFSQLPDEKVRLLTNGNQDNIMMLQEIAKEYPEVASLIFQATLLLFYSRAINRTTTL